MCRDGKGYWTLGGQRLEDKRCPPQPTSDLLATQNPTCFASTYVGGLTCCKHMHFLLDKDQTSPEDVQEYHMKFRFYFSDQADKYKHLVRLYWQTEAFAGEYDVVKCPAGTPSNNCVQVITSKWKVSDFMSDCDTEHNSFCTGKGSKDPAKTAGINLIYAGPHCHAPMCLSMELYDAKTGRLLCGAEPIIGQGTKVFDEKGYIAIPPCLWGHEPGMQEPELLPLDFEFLSVKRANSTYGHYGEMASWQMRGIVVPKSTQNILQSDLFV